MTSRIPHPSATGFALVLVFLMMPLVAQAQSEEDEQDVPRAEVVLATPLPSGEILFAVRIYASNTEPLELARIPVVDPATNPPPPEGEADDRFDPLPFSMQGSTLHIEHTGQTLKNLPRLPRRPFYGPMQVVSVLKPRGWIQMGVAFPALPPPPRIDGVNQPYQLYLEIPELEIHALVVLDPETLQPIQPISQ